MKKVLIIASVYNFFKFEKNDLKILYENGAEIHLASNMNGEKWLSDDGTLDFCNPCKHNVCFSRNPFSLKNIKALFQLKKLKKKYDFDLVHCHTPIASLITRLVFNKRKTPIIYTCHGFHFHKKSSKKTWLIYYPLEKFFSKNTSMIITINHEDFSVIQKFRCNQKKYIPGVGINSEYIQSISPDKNRIANLYNIDFNKYIIVSIGELSARKNHIVVLEAIKNLKHNYGINDIQYVICGTGIKEQEYKKFIKTNKIEDMVLLLGQVPYYDVISIIKLSNIGAFPSRIEGLGLAGLEIMACHKTLIGSAIHGIADYLIDNETGLACDPYSSKDYVQAIIKLKNDIDLTNRLSQNAYIKSFEFDIIKTEKIMKEVYKTFLEKGE